MKADADFRKQAAAAGIDIITSEPFTDDPTSQVNNIKVCRSLNLF